MTKRFLKNALLVPTLVTKFIYLYRVEFCEVESEKVKVAQSCLTFCDPMDCSPPGSFVQGILQARILEWAAIPFSRGSSQARDRTQDFCMQADSLPSEPPGKPFREVEE